MAVQGIKRELVFHDQDELEALVDAVHKARATANIKDSELLLTLANALQYGNAPAGAGHPDAPAEDNIADMSVTVTWPLRRGEMQMAVFDRDGGPDLGTMTRHDRVIVRTLLRQALENMQ